MEKSDRFVSTDQKWNAVIRRDRTADGAFYYAVRTTGIYCRPGCSSRLPKYENIEYFSTVKEAENAGYRPCRRCNPDGKSIQDKHREIVLEACRLLEDSDSGKTLENLANRSGLSRYHFQRLFKEFVGVTPSQYGTAVRAKRFRQHLQDTTSVTEAIYAAGYSSSGRAYEKVRERLAMTPKTYSKGGAGMDIHYDIVRCFLGWLLVGATEHGVCSVEFGDDPGELAVLIKNRFPEARLYRAEPSFSKIIQEVIACIEQPARACTLPLDIQGTAFQHRVWKALGTIEPGTTKSYSEVARLAGSPGAARAVGSACAANRLAVIVPCHRVVRSNGTKGAYRWGEERKRALLAREQEILSKGEEPKP